VVLTAHGAAVLRDLLPRYYEEAERVWNDLPSRRVSELLADLQRAARNAKRIAAEPPN
jgi:hypothetical protein